MRTAVIVAIAIWNGLLLTGLVVVIRWRTQLRAWVTGLDGLQRSPPRGTDGRDGGWAAFLAEHPELLQLEEEVARARFPRDASDD